MRSPLLICALCAALWTLSCRDEQAGPHARASASARRTPQQESQSGRILDQPPPLSFRSGASWDNGAVVYLGSRIEPPVVQPGQTVQVFHYFLARQPPPKGFSFFEHILDAQSGQMLANADHEIQGGAMPLGSWPVGKVVEDVSRIRIPEGGPDHLRLMLGFYQGEQRLPVDQRQAQDGSNRMVGPEITVASAALPEYHAKKTVHPPRIDGALDDAAWKEATPVVLGNSFDGSATHVRTTARVLYDDHFLYVAFDCEDPDVWGTLLKRDEAIYNEEVVEIFLDANADGRTYNELEVSPHNTIFDAYFPARRQGMDTSWDSHMVTAVKVNGTIDDPSDRDVGWTVEMKIPFDRLAEVPHLPPHPGDRWRFNLYRLEHLDRKQVEGQAFSPLFQGDFHNLPRFAWLVFDAP